MNSNTPLASIAVSSTRRVALVTSWLLTAMVALTFAARAEVVVADARVIEAQMVSQISSKLLDYARRVETLSRELDTDSRAKAEIAAYAEYDRLVWQTSMLLAGRDAAEVDEVAEIQQMIGVYRGLHIAVADASRAGNRVASARQAALAATVVDAIQVAVARIQDRTYNDLFDRPLKVAAAD